MKQIFNPHGDEWFINKIKWFMIWYGFLFVLFIFFSLSISSIKAPAPLYLLLFLSLSTTTVLIFIPLGWFTYILPLSLPFYTLFTHIFLSYTGGAASPYYPMYLMPLILASIFFRYAGAIAAFLLMLISHLILESVSLSAVISSISSEHFLTDELPVLASTLLTAVMVSVIASMLEEGRETIYRLFGQVEKAKKEWEASFDAIQDMIFILDKEQSILRVNKATTERFKKTPQELIGEKCYKLCHGLDNPIENCPHVKAMETGKPQTIEIEEPYLGGATFEVTTYPLFDNNPLNPPLLRGI